MEEFEGGWWGGGTGWVVGGFGGWALGVGLWSGAAEGDKPNCQCCRSQKCITKKGNATECAFHKACDGITHHALSLGASPSSLARRFRAVAVLSDLNAQAKSMSDFFSSSCFETIL